MKSVALLADSYSKINMPDSYAMVPFFLKANKRFRINKIKNTGY
jgi:hypothetical protein